MGRRVHAGVMSRFGRTDGRHSYKECSTLADNACLPRSDVPLTAPLHPDVGKTAADGFPRIRGLARRDNYLPPHHDDRIAVDEHGLDIPNEGSILRPGIL